MVARVKEEHGQPQHRAHGELARVGLPERGNEEGQDRDRDQHGRERGDPGRARHERNTFIHGRASSFKKTEYRVSPVTEPGAGARCRTVQGVLSVQGP